MIQQFFRLLIQRNFKRNSFYTLINIMGLSVGLTVFILFILFISEVKDYDTFHKNYNNIYRIICEKDDSRGDFAGTPAPLGQYLSERIPEIKNYARFDQFLDVVVKRNNESLFESDLLLADNSFFEIFSFQITQGNKVNPIKDINSVVISEKMAKKFFGEIDPIGEMIHIGKLEREYKISGIVEDCPKNSSIQYDFIISFEQPDLNSYWGSFNYSTYILLNNDNQTKLTEQKIKKCAVERGDNDLMKLNFLRLQPLKDLHFESVRGNTFKTIDRKYIYIFLFATIFILILASINYTNLSTAVSLNRYKEVAIKKIFGSQRKRIILEFLSESTIFALIALIVALILVELLRSFFGSLINETIQLSYSSIHYFILISLGIGILAGIYPSFYGSRYKIMELLNKTSNKGNKVSSVRNILILIQFGITSFLLICAFVFSDQLNYLFNKDLGIDTKNVYEVKVNWSGIKLPELKNELRQFAGIEDVCTSSFIAGEDGWNQSAYWKGMTDEMQISMFVHKVDKDYVKTLGINFIEKIDNYDELNFKEGENYILNKSAKDYIGWDVATGKEFSIFSQSFGQVVGVVDDYNFRSLHYETSPAVLLISGDLVPEKMHIKVKQGQENEAIFFLEHKWKEFAPDGAPLMISNLDQEFKNLYRTEQKTNTIVILFTIIALVISLLGLIGLASFMAAQRTKEIGIRKVLGANNQTVIVMLVFGFIKWVLLAFLVSAPIAYIYLNRWLSHFAYHINLKAGAFLFTAFFIFLVALLSVYIQAKRTVAQNPVDSLRYE